jgi:hypothetical protein
MISSSARSQEEDALIIMAILRSVSMIISE